VPSAASSAWTRGGIAPVSLANQAAAFFQDLPLLAELFVLAPQPPELVPLLGAQSVLALAFVPVGLGDPVPDGLRRRLELPAQLLWRLA